MSYASIVVFDYAWPVETAAQWFQPCVPPPLQSSPSVDPGAVGPLHAVENPIRTARQNADRQNETFELLVGVMQRGYDANDSHYLRFSANSLSVSLGILGVLL